MITGGLAEGAEELEEELVLMVLEEVADVEEDEATNGLAISAVESALPYGIEQPYSSWGRSRR